MKKMSILIPLFLILFCTVFSAAAQTAGSDTGLMRSGLEKFKAGRFTEALYDFREVVLDASLSDYHGSAYFWITKSYLALQNLDLAEENLKFFLTNYPGHPFFEEGMYQQGRIHYLKGEYPQAISVFYDFLNQYPDSSFAANSFFWIGECLYSLGHFQEAEKLFYRVVTQYPDSYKVEAANYRLALIDIVYREEVLLDLVKLSHEEYLTSLEDFQRRERTYEQAINSYQRRISQLETSLASRQEAPREPVRPAVSAEPAPAAPAPVQETPSQVPPAAAAVPAESEITSQQLELLELKNTTLEVKSYLMELLESRIRGGM